MVSGGIGCGNIKVSGAEAGRCKDRRKYYSRSYGVFLFMTELFSQDPLWGNPHSEDLLDSAGPLPPTVCRVRSYTWHEYTALGCLQRKFLFKDWVFLTYLPYWREVTSKITRIFEYFRYLFFSMVWWVFSVYECILNIFLI